MTMEVASIFEPKTRSIFIKSTKIPATNKDAFDYHAREGALERLVPPWSILTVTGHEGDIRDGAISTFKVRLGAYWLQMDGYTFRLFTRSAVSRQDDKRAVSKLDPYPFIHTR